MSARNFSHYGGIIMLVIGIISIIPGLEGDASSLPLLYVNSSYGLFMGQFPMNIFNKLALMIFGVAGIYVARKNDLDYSIYYSRIIFFVMGTFAILGIPYMTNTLGGYWPLYGNEIIAHSTFALVGGYCGFVSASTHHQSHA